MLDVIDLGRMTSLDFGIEISEGLACPKTGNITNEGF